MPLARRWAETLVAAVLDVPHKELHAHAGRILDPQQRRRFEELARAAPREVPLAYVIGRAPFLDWDFEVSHDTLIPKVDTELFVRAVLEELERRPLPPEPHVLELCTGSGCVAISLAKLLPGARVAATDISEEALAVARRNVACHGVEHRVALEQGDLWEPVAALAKGCPFDLILSNPPYIPTQNIADRDATLPSTSRTSRWTAALTGWIRTGASSTTPPTTWHPAVASSWSTSGTTEPPPAPWPSGARATTKTCARSLTRTAKTEPCTPAAGWSQRWWGGPAEMAAPRHPKPAARKVGHDRRT